MLTAEYLRAILRYDAATGHFTWISARSGTVIGRQAGWISDEGYICIGINRKTYKAHRLVWLYVTGAWPPHEIDHISGDRSDNRFENLRAASDIENCCNRKTRSDCVGGLKGAHFRKDKKSKQWLSHISINKKRVYLGAFDTAEEAHAAYAAASSKHHGQFSRVE